MILSWARRYRVRTERTQDAKDSLGDGLSNGLLDAEVARMTPRKVNLEVRKAFAH